jgi:alpha-N-arabinofuranosidase
MTLFCVNRSLTDDAPTQINLGAFPAQAVARAEQITAVSRYVMNDEVEPKRVVPQILSLNVDGKKPLIITLPHESITVIRLLEK